MRLWTRIAGTTVVAGALLCPAGVAAVQKAPGKTRAPASADRPMANDKTGAPALPVDVLSVSGPEASRLVPLWRVGPGDYSGFEFVDLLLATYGTHPEMLKAEFRIGTCVFRLAAPVTLQDNAPVTLVRDQPCRDRSSSSAQFWVVARGEGRIAWWTWQMPARNAVQYQGLTMTSPDAKSATRSIVRGRLYSKRP